MVDEGSEKVTSPAGEEKAPPSLASSLDDGAGAGAAPDPGAGHPLLAIASMPKKKRYRAGQSIDLDGLVVTYRGADVTAHVALDLEEGATWDAGDRERVVTATYAADGAEHAATFTLKRQPSAVIILLVVIAALLAALLATSLALRVAPTDIPFLLADAVGITSPNADVHATIEGTTTFQSPRTSDKTWKANTTSQTFVMANPDGNEVALAPHIYVDEDRDGEFSEDECVYNPIEYGKDGEVVSYGLFIDVDKQLEDIEITRPVAAGTYRAKVDYTAVDRDTHELCNGNGFVFDLTVE